MFYKPVWHKDLKQNMIVQKSMLYENSFFAELFKDFNKLYYFQSGLMGPQTGPNGIHPDKIRSFIGEKFERKK